MGNVRPFWITAKVDGRSTEVATGPAARDGGFDMTVQQRSKGKPIKALSVRGSVIGTEVCTTVVLPEGQAGVRVEIEGNAVRIYTEA